MRTRGSRVPRDANLSNELRSFLDDLDRRIPYHNLTATAAPGVTDDGDAGYSLGSIWINLTTDNIYMCADTTAGAAVWRQLN
jgi:hypothetical protein